MYLNNKNQMQVLFSFKNIHIWPSYGQKMAHMPIFWHTFFDHNSAIFGPIGLTFFMETKETIIHWLVVRNPSYDAYFSLLIFWVTFGVKMGVVTTRAPSGRGSPNPAKKLADRVDLLDKPLFRNNGFEFFNSEHPLKW